MKEFVFDLQRFNEDRSSLGGLVLLNTVMTTLRLKELVAKFKDDPVANLKKDANPILKFIGTYLEEITGGKSDEKTKIKSSAKIIASLISIVDSAVKINKYNKEDNPPIAEITKESELIVAELANVTNEIVNLASGKKSLVLPITASAISLVANGITALDGVTDAEKDKINASYLGFMKSLAFDKALIKKLFSSEIASKITNSTVEDLGKISKTFTNAGGVLDLVFAAMQGVLNGINKYKAIFKKYTEDGIPEDMAKRDAFINAFTAVIHDTAHAYTKGLDDVAYNGIKTLIWAFTGKEGIEGNYVEVMTEMLKVFNYTNTGDAEDNFLLGYLNDEMIYGYDGNDYIANIASNMKIWGGHDNDTIVSREGSGDDYSTPQGNSILGGPGKDLIIAYDTNSTIDGGADNDRIAVLGTKNKIYGADGTDVLLIKDGADSNTVNGGLGDDYIILESVQNAVIEYNEGDGNDIVLGYDESDVIHITSDYSTSINGQDVIIAVGDGSITLSGASGKEININGTKQLMGSKPTNPPLIIILPSVWYEGINIIRGTSGNEYFDNISNFVEINGGDGDDTINNEVRGEPAGGSNVTINGGSGNDSIKNDGGSVIINGDADNDSIENWAQYVLISGGLDNDKIYSSGSTVTIDGGADDDTISNGGYYDSNGFYNDGGSNVTIKGGAGNDSIYNEGNSVTIGGGEGDDTIKSDNWIDTVSINGGEGDDSIESGLTGFATIDGGTGNDTIWVNGHDIKIFGDEGNDFITNAESWRVTINSGEGNDTIQNSSWNRYSTINGGLGNDSICNDSDDVLFVYNSGDGNDTIWGFNKTSTLSIDNGTGSYSSTKSSDNKDIIITVGTGKITLLGAASLSKLNIAGKNTGSSTQNLNRSNSRASTTLSGGSGDDTLINWSGGKYSTINGWSGNDSIKNTAANVTITGGADNDTVTNTGANVLFNYTSGEGNDLIQGFRADSTLKIGGGTGSYSSTKSGNDIVVTVGTGKVTLQGAASLSKLNISGKSTSSSTQNLNRSNSKANIRFNGGAGDDTLTNWTGGKGSTINGWSGNDSIKNTAANVSINGGIGNDKITNSGANVTIEGGAGNDTLWGGNSADTFVYNNGEGKDIIYGFDNTDMLQITGDWSAAYYSGSGKILFKVGSTYSAITLQDFSASTFNINGTAYKISGNTLVKK